MVFYKIFDGGKSMKRTVLSVIMAFAAAGLAFANGGQEQAKSAPAAGGAAAAPAAQEKTVTLKIGYSTNAEDPRGQASAMFKKNIEALDPSIKVEIFPGGQMGGDAALIEAMTNDSQTVNIIISDASNFSTYVPQTGISALPFMFKDFDHAFKFMNSKVEKDAEALLIPDNVRVIGHMSNGFRCVTSSKKQVKTPADMKGMLIRTPENPMIMAAMRALGANPQPLAFNELYMALQQGTYDGQENPIPVIFNNKLYEVQKYLAVTNHIYSDMYVGIAESTWKSMSAKQQQEVQQEMDKACAFDRQLTVKQTNDFVDQLKAKGMTINNPDLAPFVAACKVVYTQQEKSIGKEWIERVNQWLAANP
jgi:tripartite ATP-independent transporter DctP family solute receptor